LFVQRKKQRKGAENDNCSLFGRPLRDALMALPNMLQFAPFSGCPRALQDKESNMDFGQAKNEHIK
jgi:hypothetical protein